MAAYSSSSSKSVWPTRVLMLVLATASGGCQWVFGDFEFQPEEGTGGGGAGGSSAAATGGAPSCFPEGRHQCVDWQPQTCTNGNWTNVGSRCSAEALCNVTTGGCDLCARGTKSCSSDGKSVLTCNADNNGWTTTRTCTGSAPMCDADKHDCVACGIGEGHCISTTSLQTCNKEQTGFDEFICSGYPCFTLSSTEAYCATCDPAVDTAYCTTAGVLRKCSSTHKIVETGCTNGCVDATITTPAYCK